MSRIAALSMAALAMFAGPAAAVDNVDCPPIPSSGPLSAGSLCLSIPTVLDNAGWARDSTELSSNTLALPGTAGDTADLTFDLLHDDGAFNFCFGFCLAGNLDAATLAAVRTGTATDEQQFEFAKNCVIDNGVMVFDDRVHDDGAQTIISDVDVPAEVIFFLIPDETSGAFAADPENFWATERHPLFSESAANPEYLDQLVLFTNEGNTLFAWEDKTRVRQGGTVPVDSDEDFGDLVFKLDTVISSTPPPVVGGCPAECTSETAAYDAEGNQMESVTGTGNCACLSFDC